MWRGSPGDSKRFHVEGVAVKRFHVKRFHVEGHAHISADMYLDVETWVRRNVSPKAERFDVGKMRPRGNVFPPRRRGNVFAGALKNVSTWAHFADVETL